MPKTTVPNNVGCPNTGRSDGIGVLQAHQLTVTGVLSKNLIQLIYFLFVTFSLESLQGGVNTG